MSIFLQPAVETPSGPVFYVVREHAGAFFTGALIARDFAPAAGDEFEAELWGESFGDPMYDVVLRRTPDGWVEASRVEI